MHQISMTKLSELTLEVKSECSGGKDWKSSLEGFFEIFMGKKILLMDWQSFWLKIYKISRIY